MPDHTLSQKSDATLIASDIEFSGDLEFEGELEIQGSFEGCVLTKGSIHVHSNAILKADISANTVHIAGRMQGVVRDANFVHLRPGAKFQGDIHCKEIQIDREAFIDGVILMEPSDK